VTQPPAPALLFHLALREEWEQSVAAGGPYARSTFGKSLAEVGFVHCCLASQVQAVADAFYRGREDVVMMVVDPSRLAAPLLFEEAPGTGQAFPHVYGPLPLSAVLAAVAVPLGADGRLMAADLAAAQWTIGGAALSGAPPARARSSKTS
jgi:uncharacterized protein (DUF952 family)